MPSRILVVEDNNLEQEALKAALESDGYIVDSAADGLSAVRKLRSGRYDLALVDYQLPEVDGLASARLLHEYMDANSVPRLVAITAASKELEARQGKDGVFDAIVPKPYDLGEVLKIVGREIRGSPSVARSAAADQMWRSVGLKRRPAAIVVPELTSNAALMQSLFDMRGIRTPEVIVIADEAAWAEVANLRESADCVQCPVIDLTGRFADLADCTLTDFGRDNLLTVANVTRQFAERFEKLAPRFRLPGTLADRILAYLFLSGRDLTALRFAQSKSLIRYVGFFSAPVATAAADELETRGLVTKTFFDRLHVCGTCSSSRLNAREECPSCRSANLRSEPLIHHFRCAHQAPESEFAADGRLMCPKCRRELRHYGSDYDKPGKVSCCEDCGDVNSDPAVGFVCFDCGSHTDGDAVPVSDVYSFALTDAARVMLEAHVPHAVPIAQIAAPIPAEVEEAVTLSLPADRPGSETKLLEIAFASAPQVIARLGRSGFDTLRRIFMQNLRSELPAPVEVYSDDERDLVLGRQMPGDLASGDILARCQETLSERLDPIIRWIDLMPWKKKIDDRSALCP
jgi:CheY-like chemotaxis protein